MFQKGKVIVRDVLFVSKITRVNNKKRTIFGAVLLAQLSAFTDIAIIIFFSILITGDFPNILMNFSKQFETIKYLIPFLVIFRFLFHYLQGVILKTLELNVNKNIKTYLLGEIFEKRNYSVSDAYFFMNTLSGHLAFFYSNAASFLNSILQMSAYLIYLIYADSRTLITFSVGIIVLFYPVKIVIEKARLSMHDVYNYSKKLNDEIQRIVENIFLIKILKKDEDELDGFSVSVENLTSSELKNFRMGLINSQIPGFTTLFVFSCILVISNVAKQITLDFVGVTLRLFQAFGQLTGSFNRVINSSVHIEKFYEMEKNKSVLDKDNFILNKEMKKNEIEIKDVSFQYYNSEAPIFENLNLTINKNEHIILTGPNGSGKSTLLGLMSGVFYPSSGKVYTNSTKMGYIGPIPLIFTASLRDNLLYGNEKLIDDNNIVKELKLFDTFKEEDNYNLDRIISNKTLSSGQMQKIAFIRALLAEVDILFLDESTSNLDDKARNLIFEILDKNELTIINSTHDPEKFSNVDLHYYIEILNEKRVIKKKE
jgi:ABC-type multidrug transport system fused ATPase/permease subunit